MGTEALGRSLIQDRLVIASQYALCTSLLSAVSCARGTPGESMQQAVAQDLADVWRLWARSVCVLRGAGQVDQCTRMGREQRGSRVAGRLGRLGRGVAWVAGSLALRIGAAPASRSASVPIAQSCVLAAASPSRRCARWWRS